jgi:predicted site-specific integrase-resolvase
MVLGDLKMTPNNTSAGMRGEIQKQWSKFTYAEVSALKNKDDLVAQVQTKYTLDKAQAQKDVDAFAKGRQL